MSQLDPALLAPSVSAVRATVLEQPRPRFAQGTSPPGSVTVPMATPVQVTGPITIAMATPTAPSRRAIEASLRAAPGRRPRAAIGISVGLAILALVIAPFAPIAWMHATEQLDLVDRGACRPTARAWLVLAQGIGIAMTMVAVAATAFGFTVLVVR